MAGTGVFLASLNSLSCTSQTERSAAADIEEAAHAPSAVSVVSTNPAAATAVTAQATPHDTPSLLGPAKRVDEKFIVENAAATKEWPSYGLNYAETRFSKLTQVSADNVKDLGLVWSYDLGSKRGVEATPIVVDGVMYVTASWSVVHAIDVRTGKQLWTYDPQVPRREGYRGCCDVVNRGVAVYDGRVYVGALDGRLVALDAATGSRVWEKDTRPSPTSMMTVTGAPRAYKGKIFIGNGGAELGVRGYVTAYDAKTGDQVWRWYTVPGDPSKPFENKAMEKAAKTWDPSGRYWEGGGGGTVWNSIAFDPELNLMYIGVGNGAPWSAAARSPKGGDNLFLSSIVALNPDTGEYVWHYQETPSDNWDYTATQDIILADLTLAGRPRKVLLHAPKNGFFFVIDRTDGKFISAKNFVEVNWATGYDAKGRPIERKEVRSNKNPYDIVPGPFGGHNWQSMSFNPNAGLAYIPAQNVPLTLAHDSSWKYGSNLPGQPMSGVGWNTGTYVNAKPPTSKPYGRLIAWDPVKQKKVWQQDYVGPWNGGTLTTAGNLVFQGTADGRFVAYHATTGQKLWESPTGTGVIAAPVTYEVDGQQFVSIAVGWGGVLGQSVRMTERSTPGTVYTFALGGKAPLPKFVGYQLGNLLQGVPYDKKHVQEGTLLYVSNCVFCHGVPGVDKGGNIPNLGYSQTATISNLDKFVFNGPLISQGMPDFTGKLTPEQVEKIKAFIQGTADAIRPSQPKPQEQTATVN